MIVQPRRFKSIRILIGGFLILVITLILLLILNSWSKFTFQKAISVEPDFKCFNTSFLIHNKSDNIVDLNGVKIHYNGQKIYTFSHFWLLPGMDTRINSSSFWDEAIEVNTTPGGSEYFFSMTCDFSPPPTR